MEYHNRVKVMAQIVARGGIKGTICAKLRLEFQYVQLGHGHVHRI